MRALLFALAFTLFSPPVLADSMAEQDERFRTVQRQWLSGRDDLQVLQDLSALANRGNVASQVLLGMIHAQPQMHNHATKDLSREDRRSIFYKPNDGFGERWLKIASRSHSLAALLTKGDVTDYESHSKALADAGAIEQAINFANLLLSDDHLAAMRSLGHPNLLPYTKVSLHWYAETIEYGLRVSNRPGEADDVMKLRLKLPGLEFKDSLLAWRVPDFIPLHELTDESDTLRLRGAALLHHPDLKPFADILRSVCPEDTAYHMGVLYYLKNRSSLQMVLLSPLEPIVSTSEWQKSERFRGDLLRDWPPGTPHFKILQDISDCFAKAVLAEM